MSLKCKERLYKSSVSYLPKQSDKWLYVIQEDPKAAEEIARLKRKIKALR